MAPYSDLTCDFLHDLASLLLSDEEAKNYSDIATFAFWCRRANIQALKSGFLDHHARLGLGLVFHIAPSNVPINFAFSFVFGLLAGNANIVKCASKPAVQYDIASNAINEILKDPKYDQIRRMTAIIKYDRDDELTAFFSSHCSARIIWGGDMTINHIRSFPIPARAVEVAFADRYSFCVINAPDILTMDEPALKQLVNGFYNDTYLMDQQACSAPHLIVWMGADKDRAKDRFWHALNIIATQKYELSEIMAVDKYMQMCQCAIDLEQLLYFKNIGNHIYRIGLRDLPETTADLRGQYGFFYEYDASDLNDLATVITSQYQTLTYFGIDKEILSRFVTKNRLPGIDRIVPIGSALDMHVIWDGYDVIGSLSRIIDVH